MDVLGADATVCGELADGADPSAYDPGPLQREDGADEERDPRERTQRVAGRGKDDRLADG